MQQIILSPKIILKISRTIPAMCANPFFGEADSLDLFEFGLEIIAFQAVDGPAKAFFFIVKNHPCTLRTGVGVIVGSIKNIVYTIFPGNRTIESAHSLVLCFAEVKVKYIKNLG